MKSKIIFVLGVLALVALAGCDSTCKNTAQNDSWVSSWRAQNPVWRGLHVMMSSDKNVDQLIAQIPALQNDGVNVIIAEVGYNFEFQSHPELRSSQYITRAGAQRLAQAAHEHGMRLIPELDCLGHQSWSKNTMPLLSKYPQLEENPGPDQNKKDFYCRSWCPENPDVNPIVFSLVDELIDGFDADAFHVGMDEVFVIASPYCPRCHGKDPAKLFAKQVNDLHRHIVGQRHVEMLMWDDRLLDAKALHYSIWDAATNGTPAAIDMIPKDIIVCDWHYEKHPSYDSVPLLLKKGFRVWPCGWQPLSATEAFSAYSKQQREQNPRVIGYLCSVWGKVKIPDVADWPPVKEPLRDWK